jgi:ribonucleoside-diphosphate reductase alpha chain
MMTEEEIRTLLERCRGAVGDDLYAQLQMLGQQAMMADKRPDVTEVRPQTLECDVVRFQNNKEKWVALVGLLDGYPYEIFTGLQDDEEGISCPRR